MGLLYERDRRVAKDKNFPEIKETDTMKRSGLVVVPTREHDIEEFTEEWDELDLFEDEIVDEDVDPEEVDEEAF